MLLESIFQYRTLLGKTALGAGLDWDEIDQLSALEFQLAAPANHRRRRRFRRDAIKLSAVMRGCRINDRVDIVELAAGGLVCKNAPYVARGEQVEIVIEDGDRSYRFRAIGVWLKDDGDDFRVGLALVGVPICLHKVAISAHHLDVVDKLAAAA